MDLNERENSPESFAELKKEILMRKRYDDIFAEIKTLHSSLPAAHDTDFVCYRNLMEDFEKHCGAITEYGLKYMRSFYDSC